APTASLPPSATRRSADLHRHVLPPGRARRAELAALYRQLAATCRYRPQPLKGRGAPAVGRRPLTSPAAARGGCDISHNPCIAVRSEEHTSELQSRENLVC